MLTWLMLLPRVIPFVNDWTSHYFIVSGHFLGNHSVLDILRQEGYEVEHTSAQEPATT